MQSPPGTSSANELGLAANYQLMMICPHSGKWTHEVDSKIGFVEKVAFLCRIKSKYSLAGLYD